MKTFSLALRGFACLSAVALAGAAEWVHAQVNPARSATTPAVTARPAGAQPATAVQLSDGDKILKTAPGLAATAASESDFNRLMAVCDQGLANNPSAKNQVYATTLKAWCLSKRGELKIKTEKYAEAMVDFNASIELDPKRWKAFYNRGTQFAREGKYQEAIADLNKSLELKGDNNDAFFNRAELHAAQREWKEAVADYTSSIRIAPQDPAAYASRGDAYIQLQDYKSAVTDLTKAIALAPEDAVLYARRGTMAWQQGEYPLANADYRMALTLDNKLGPAYIGASWMMSTCADARYREPSKALEAAQKAIELDGDKDYRYLDTLAAAQAANGRFDEAAATQVRAIDAAPEALREKQQQRLDLFKGGKPYFEGRAAALPASVPLPSPKAIVESFDDDPLTPEPPLSSVGSQGLPPGFQGNPAAKPGRAGDATPPARRGVFGGARRGQ